LRILGGVNRPTVTYGASAPEDLPDELEVTTIVEEDDGLAGALEPIAAGQAGTLFVHKLESVAGSFGELIRLLDWLAEAGADLVAADVGLDTATAQGRRMVALLREIDRWGREPGPAGRPGGHAKKRPRGRPGLTAGAPHVAERIAELRERGLSLQAIADTLNAEGIPTPRGGAQWRPSSVQSALGYRRPRPPAPGAPPPRPLHGPGHKPPGPPHLPGPPHPPGAPDPPGPPSKP
jgi:hypothetical protein